jgi:4-nitrophenyl phosphatase
MAAKPTTPSQLQAVIDCYDTFMFDCDGVLWHGDHLIPGTIEVLAYLRQQSKCHLCLASHDILIWVYSTEKHILFVTNNATKSRRNYKGKFDKLGVQAEVVSRISYLVVDGAYISYVLP